MVEGLQRVVVTGLGAVTPIGNTVSDYWDGLSSGRNGVAGITLFDASAHACRFAAEVKDFDPTGFLEAKEAKRWDRFCKFGVVAAKQAVADAGLAITDANADRIFTRSFKSVATGMGINVNPGRDRYQKVVDGETQDWYRLVRPAQVKVTDDDQDAADLNPLQQHFKDAGGAA